jgi:aminopeptidase
MYTLMTNFSFMKEDGFQVQQYAKKFFYDKLLEGTMHEVGYSSVDFLAFKTTGGSNLDPADDVQDENGNTLSLESDVCAKYDIILAITDYSLTAPLTAMAKKYNFRGATLHGVNDIILGSGLAVDYNEISKQAEVFRLVLDQADAFELNFEVHDKSFSLTINCDQQSAQKSHGLCPPGMPDVANLPAGEVYFVPSGANGSFPFRYSDGTIAEMVVSDGAIQEAILLNGNASLVDDRNKQLKDDPATGIIGELGFGTQLLPFSGKDIQDEKILGTCHVATGRSDHLGGNLTPDLFNSRLNASHDDILFAPPKTPEITVTSVVMQKQGESKELFTNFIPTSFLLSQLDSVYSVDHFTSLAS